MNKKTIANALLLATQSMRRNKGRTGLTVLGIVIGITAVIAVMSAGIAIKGLIVGEIQSFGANAIEIEVKTPQASQASAENAFSMVGGSVITTLKEADGKAVAKHPNIKNFYAGVIGQSLISYQSEIKKSMLFGVNAPFIDIDQGSKMATGRFFTDEEDAGLAQVAVIGSKVKDRLFGDEDPVGKTIKIGKANFKIIGVMAERGPSFSFDWDNMVFMPLKTLQKKIMGIDYVMYIMADMIDPELGEQTVEELTDIMRDQHDITDPTKDDFAVITMAQALEMTEVIVAGIQILLILLGSISLIVGGVGIMNIMYVSVTERTYEIGLRKSLGAKKNDILWQFLIEAVIMTIAGGLIGIILGIALTALVSAVASSQGFAWEFSISWMGMFLAVTMSTLVGVLFGLYPARRAAALDPIVALRQE